MSSRSDDAADRPLSTQPSGTFVVASLASSFVIDGVSSVSHVSRQNLMEFPLLAATSDNFCLSHRSVVRSGGD
ncbi:MAG: hypothetical protein JNL58_29145 [Planctomyces sp.]|nr:hypothetical protein [Planctomyces sp.]